MTRRAQDNSTKYFAKKFGKSLAKVWQKFGKSFDISSTLLRHSVFGSQEQNIKKTA